VFAFLYHMVEMEKTPSQPSLQDLKEAPTVVKISLIVPPETIENSPSRADNVSKTDEDEQRVFGCELIQEAGTLLRSPQEVMATGQTLLHRFYYRQSLVKNDVFKVAMASLFLAAKVEESPKKLKEILFVFHRLWQKRCGFPIEPMTQKQQVFVTLSLACAIKRLCTHSSLLPFNVFIETVEG
jgi:hypothetical protein